MSALLTKILTTKHKVILSDGSVVSNWDCLDSLNEQFSTVIVEELKISPILLTGSALPKRSKIVPVMY